MNTTTNIGNSKLMLHCGAELVSEDFVRNLTPPAPEGRHYPVPYSNFIDDTVCALKDQGFVIGDFLHSTSHDHQRYFGLMQASIPKRHTTGDIVSLPDKPFRFQLTARVTNTLPAPYGHLMWDGQYLDPSGAGVGHGIEPVPEWEQDNPIFEQVVGLRSSWDKSFSLQLAMGTRVFVCDNLCFNGEVVIRRKNTVNAVNQLANLAQKAVGRVEALQIDEAKRTDAYMIGQLPDKDAKAAMFDIARAKSVGVSKLNRVWDLYSDPEDTRFLNDSGERTVWTLKNAFTEAFKDYHLDTLPERSRGLNVHLDRLAGFQPAVAALQELN